MQYSGFLSGLLLLAGMVFLLQLRKGLHYRYVWYCAFMALGAFTNGLETFLQSIGITVAMRDRDYLDPASAALFFELILSDFALRLMGLFFVELFLWRKLANLRYPRLVISYDTILRFAVTYSAIAVILRIALQFSGYIGYFRDPALEENPLAWIDPVQKVLDLGVGMCFVAIIIGQVTNRRGAAVIVLAAAWVFSGLLSGFKSQVFLPVFMFAVSSWLVGRFRWRYAAYSILALLAAYSIIEPLRSYREAELGGVSVLGAYEALLDSPTVDIADPSATLQRFISRIDSSEIGIIALYHYQFGGLAEYRRAQDLIYEHWFGMAFVPRMLWAEKPLANLGQVLYRELFSNQSNSLTIQSPVALYIWGGITPVLIFGFVNGAILAIASVLISVWVRNPIVLFPVLLLAVAISKGEDYEIFYLIGLVRVIIGFSIFVLVGRKLGILVLERQRSGNQMPVTAVARRGPKRRANRPGPPLYRREMR